MDYAYDNVTHQVGYEQVDKNGNGEDKVVETFFSYATANKVVIRCDKDGVYFTIINIDSNKMLGSAHTKQFNISHVKEALRETGTDSPHTRPK